MKINNDTNLKAVSATAILHLSDDNTKKSHLMYHLRSFLPSSSSISISFFTALAAALEVSSCINFQIDIWLTETNRKKSHYVYEAEITENATD